MAKIVMEEGSLPAAPAPGKTALAVNTLGQLATVNDSGVSLLLQSATVEISSAELLTLKDSPVAVVPAPGEGFCVVPFAVFSTVKPGGTPYTEAGNALFSVGTWSHDPAAWNLAASADSSKLFNLLDSLGGSDEATADLENQPFTVGATTSNPADGDGTLTVTVFYTVVDVS